MKSILQKEKVCFISGSTSNLEEHHIFYGSANRKLSEKYGLKVYLTKHFHTGDINGNQDAVHFNRDLDAYLKQKAQTRFEYTHTREEFITIFGRSYL